MPARDLHTLAQGGFFECPRWHDGRWWVSDFYRLAVFTYTADGAETHVLTVDSQPGGIGWHPDGSLVVAACRERRLLCRRPDGTVAELANLEGVVGGQLNDLVVDQQGRAWVGNFGYDVFAGGPAVGADLVRVDPDGTVATVARDLLFPNGSVVTEDGATLVVGESFAHRLTAFTITDAGALVDRRVWADLDGAGIDGCCLDAEGRIWVADPTGGRCRLVAEGGAVVDEVDPGRDLHVYACMLGGDDGRTLVMCCSPGFEREPEARRARGPGELVSTTVDVPRAGMP
jgi:sugar lactone lactonase YvrE